MRKGVKIQESGSPMMFILGLFGLAYVLFGTSGCALTSKGTEFYASAGMRGIDEHEERSKMHRGNIPFRCWFVQCSAEEVQGS